MTTGVLRIPTRYEALLQTVGRSNLSQVILKPLKDLVAITQAIIEVKSAQQGKIVFLLGDSGAGKTTLAASTQIYLNDQVSDVLVPPADYTLPLGELPAWLSKNVKTDKSKITLVNLDGRELPSLDHNARAAAMVNLNAYLRRTPRILVVWPVIQQSFAEELIGVLKDVGGASALSSSAIHKVLGLKDSEFYDALQLILTTTGARLEDAAVTRQEVEVLASRCNSIGQYLEKVNNLVVERFDTSEIGFALPRVNIIVTSNGDSAESCRMLRRGSKFLADPERLLQFSRSNSADDWRKRAERNARHSLPFIASLFELRILHLTASSVVNACAFSSSPAISKAVRKHYPNPVKSNAKNTLQNSSLYRALTGSDDVGPAGGATTPAVSGAFAEIQALSKTEHRAINEAIVAVLTGQLNMQLPDLDFEYEPHEDEGLRVDVWFKTDSRPTTLEFTHRMSEELSPASISSYVLSKITDYARDYSLL